MIKSLKLLAVIVLALFVLSINFGQKSDKPSYGVSFSKFHTDELGLDFKSTYLAILDDLGVRKFRFSAHWPIIEPQEGKYNFSELDFQIEEAEKRNAEVILAVGRRLPGWPECHIPNWAKDLKPIHREEKILDIIGQTVNRYKNSKSIKYWQVENEPFLAFFSKEACGSLDEDFLDKEIELVRSLDPTRQIIVTDSGEFGTWYQAYRKADVFGTSLYLYVWWKDPVGPFRYPIWPGFFNIKNNLMKLFFSTKPSFVIELSSEPWLRKPIVETDIDTQFERMGIDKFKEMVDFSSKTGFDTFYLWGAEWWYWLKLKGYSEHWDYAKTIFSSNKN